MAPTPLPMWSNVMSMDTISPAERSEIMSRVRSKDSRPEMALRKLVFSLGYRYRLHNRALPGCPDLVFSALRKVVFVHGCFWHLHKNCPLARMPKSRVDFWSSKLELNKTRDEKNVRKLRRLGWRVLTIWECEIARNRRVSDKIMRFLNA